MDHHALMDPAELTEWETGQKWLYLDAKVVPDVPCRELSIISDAIGRNLRLARVSNCYPKDRSFWRFDMLYLTCDGNMCIMKRTKLLPQRDWTFFRAPIGYGEHIDVAVDRMMDTLQRFDICFDYVVDESIIHSCQTMFRVPTFSTVAELKMKLELTA